MSPFLPFQPDITRQPSGWQRPLYHATAIPQRHLELPAARQWRRLGLVLVFRPHYGDAEAECDDEGQHLDHHDGGDDADHHPDVVLEELHQRVPAALSKRGTKSAAKSAIVRRPEAPSSGNVGPS